MVACSSFPDFAVKSSLSDDSPAWMRLPAPVPVAEKANDELLEWRSRPDLSVGCVDKKGPGVMWRG